MLFFLGQGFFQLRLVLYLRKTLIFLSSPQSVERTGVMLALGCAEDLARISCVLGSSLSPPLNFLICVRFPFTRPKVFLAVCKVEL